MKKTVIILASFFLTQLNTYAQHSISGQILRYDGTPVSGVLAATAQGTSTSDEEGNYSISSSEPFFDYFQVSKDAIYPMDVTNMDMIATRRHMLLMEELNIFQQLAADVNNNGSITGSDLVQMKSMILGMIDEFQNSGYNMNWNFISPELADEPLGGGFPLSYIMMNNPLVGEHIFDYVGVKRGDVVNTNGLLPDEENNPIFGLEHSACGNTVKLTCKAEDYENLLGTQFALRWNPEVLTFSSLSQDGYFTPSPNGYSLQDTEEGILRVIFSDMALGGVALEDGTKLLDLTFEIIGDIEGEIISFDENIMPLEVVTGDMRLANATFGDVTLSAPSPEIIADIISTNASNSNSFDGSFSIDNVSGGTPPYSFFCDETNSTESSQDNLDAGDYHITITDSNGCTLTLIANVSSTVALEEVGERSIVKLIQNPIEKGGRIDLELNSFSREDLSVTLLNSLGKIVIIQKEVVGQNDRIQLAAPNIAGNYWLIIQNKEGREVLPLVVY